MARFDLAPVDPDIEPFVRKSAGGSWYSSKGNVLWTETTSDQAQGEAILSHELSHFFVHVGTPYGMLIESLGQLQERLVLQYCGALAAQGSPVRYPVHGYVQRDDALVDPSLVTKYVRPWSRLVQLERILDGSNVRAVRDATIPDAIELLADLEDLERAMLAADGGDPADLGERPSFEPMLAGALANLAVTPACPRFYPAGRPETVAGGAALFEGLAQAAERMVYPEHWDILLRGMSRDQYLGFYASVFMAYGLERADSQEDFGRVFETFIALCDLALQTPIGSIYGKLRRPDCDFGDLHPGWRFLRLLDHMTDDDWIDSLDDLPSLQETLAARLGWPDPRMFQLLGSTSDQPAHAEAMRIRQREPAFHLFLADSAPAFLAEYGPLTRDPRTGEIMPSLHDRVKLGPVVNYIMWRLTWQVMMGPRLDIDEALPEGIYGRRWFENIDTKQDLATLFFDAVPMLNPAHFVLTPPLGERMDDDWLSGSVEPLPGNVAIGGQKDWVDAALWSRAAFGSGLRSIGLPEDEVERAVSLRDDTDAQLRAIELDIESYSPPGVLFAVDPVPAELYAKRRSIRQRLADYFSDREVQVRDTAVIEVRVPLFVLACADVTGCTATFDRQEMKSRPLTWGLTVFGNGLSGSRELKASAEASFTAAAGQIKVVFQPLKLMLQQVVVLLDGRQVGGGVQVDTGSVRTDSSPGLRLLSAEARPEAGPPVWRYPLADDTTGALATYKRTYERTSKRNLSLGVDAFHTKVSLTVGAELTTQVELQYELRGGHDYTLLRAAEGDGLLWAPAGLPGNPA